MDKIILLNLFKLVYLLIGLFAGTVSVTCAFITFKGIKKLDVEQIILGGLVGLISSAILLLLLAGALK